MNYFIAVALVMVWALSLIAAYAKGRADSIHWMILQDNMKRIKNQERAINDSH